MERPEVLSIIGNGGGGERERETARERRREREKRRRRRRRRKKRKRKRKTKIIPEWSWGVSMGKRTISGSSINWSPIIPSTCLKPLELELWE
jgi:hypothetical protein